MEPLIYGKNNLDRIVSIEPGNSTAEVFRELEDGSVVSETVPCSHYLLYNQQLSPKFKRLKGDQYYKYMIEYDNWDKYNTVLKTSYQRKYDFHVIRDPKESLMVKDGYTYFKNMKVEDVSVLSFDIETVGLAFDGTSKVLLIANTFRKQGKVTRRLFSVDEYESDKHMIMDWVGWVNECDPSIMLGHNIFGYDLPYISHCHNHLPLLLGRNGSALKFSERSSQFRKDGSQAYDYNNALVYGRELIDTYFLSMKYDVAARREYESYGLKAIIQHEGLERKDRQHYNAGDIAKNWNDPVERAKIKKYAIHDADDALKLYDLMIPSFFYYTQSIPRSFQSVINTATGSQFNSLMVRGYLQQGHSIAKGSDKEEFLGAISFGRPGIHKNVFKIDVQSLYPSIILSKKLYNKSKDPQGLFLKIMEFFTDERIRNKELGETTESRYHRDLSDSQKIVINTGYGFLAAPKLNYNSPADASTVTEVGREILKKAILWASGSEYIPELKEGDSHD